MREAHHGNVEPSCATGLPRDQRHGVELPNEEACLCPGCNRTPCWRFVDGQFRRGGSALARPYRYYAKPGYYGAYVYLRYGYYRRYR